VALARSLRVCLSPSLPPTFSLLAALRRAGGRVAIFLWFQLVPPRLFAAIAFPIALLDEMF
jgi:hypothetical protein